MTSLSSAVSSVGSMPMAVRNPGPWSSTMTSAVATRSLSSACDASTCRDPATRKTCWSGVSWQPTPRSSRSVIVPTRMVSAPKPRSCRAQKAAGTPPAISTTRRSASGPPVSVWSCTICWTLPLTARRVHVPGPEGLETTRSRGCPIRAEDAQALGHRAGAEDSGCVSGVVEWGHGVDVDADDVQPGQPPHQL